MEQPVPMPPLEVFAVKSGEVNGAAKGRDSTLPAGVREVNAKFAIHAPVENFSVGGWKVTDSYIVLYGRNR